VKSNGNNVNKSHDQMRAEQSPGQNLVSAYNTGRRFLRAPFTFVIGCTKTPRNEIVSA
jgi:hypothetical protein